MSSMIIRYHGAPNVAIALYLFFPVLFGLELRMNPTTSSRMPTYFAETFIICDNQNILLRSMCFEYVAIYYQKIQAEVLQS